MLPLQKFPLWRNKMVNPLTFTMEIPIFVRLHPFIEMSPSILLYIMDDDLWITEGASNETNGFCEKDP